MAMQVQMQPQVQPQIQPQSQPQQQSSPIGQHHPSVGSIHSRKSTGVDLREFDGGRLIVQGADPSDGSTNLRGNLANRLPNLNLLFLAEMDEFIQAHGATIPSGLAV